MDAPAAGCGDHLLTEFANEDRPLADLGESFDHADDVSLRDWRLESKQEIGRSQMEEVDGVGLQNLAVMH